jgi:hypothetical protein
MSDKSIFPSASRKKDLMTLLKMLGGEFVEVSFSGGGDTGEINDVTLLDQNSNPISIAGAELEWEEVSSYHDPEVGEWRTRSTTLMMTLDKILTQVTYDALETTQLDWYNNEGGQGTLHIDLTKEPPAIELNVEVNYIHTENHAFDMTEEE